MSNRRLNTDHLGIRLCVHQARKAVTGVTSDAATIVHVLLIQHDAEWCVKRTEAVACKVVTQLLDTRFVADRWVERRGACWGRGRIYASLTVYLIEMLGFSVKGFHLLVA